MGEGGSDKIHCSSRFGICDDGVQNPKKIAKGCVMPYLNSGGVMTMTIKEFIEMFGGNYVSQINKEGWVLEIWRVSIVHY
jgi:hypothetical protein